MSRSIRLQAAVLFAAVAAAVALVWTMGVRIAGRDQQKELHGYLRRAFPPLHVQARSVQAGLAGLIDDTAPSAAGAIAILNDEILPTIERILAAARPVTLEGIDAQALHVAYLQCLGAMKSTAEAARAVFADPSLDLAAKRARVKTLLDELRGRFDSFYARASEVCRLHGISFAP